VNDTRGRQPHRSTAQVNVPASASTTELPSQNMKVMRLRAHPITIVPALLISLILGALAASAQRTRESIRDIGCDDARLRLQAWRRLPGVADLDIDRLTRTLLRASPQARRDAAEALEARGAWSWDLVPHLKSACLQDDLIHVPLDNPLVDRLLRDIISAPPSVDLRGHGRIAVAAGARAQPELRQELELLATLCGASSSATGGGDEAIRHPPSGMDAESRAATELLELLRSPAIAAERPARAALLAERWLGTEHRRDLMHHALLSLDERVRIMGAVLAALRPRSEPPPPALARAASLESDPRVRQILRAAGGESIGLDEPGPPWQREARLVIRLARGERHALLDLGRTSDPAALEDDHLIVMRFVPEAAEHLDHHGPPASASLRAAVLIVIRSLSFDESARRFSSTVADAPPVG